MTLAVTVNAWEADLNRIIDRAVAEPVELTISQAFLTRQAHTIRGWKITGTDGLTYARCETLRVADALAEQMARAYGNVQYAGLSL